ncbi:MAG TPA: dihydrolipoamide acetyltransferase family protein [Tepidisphaeraceae bacterium]|jgi:pyruvate dehydrogenase E2 component (dihydrolipoamide acetyltransferase)
MPGEITMPQLSDTMAEGTLLKWMKKEGDKVKEGEVCAEVETDKANMEMESQVTGTIALLTAKEGDKLKVRERMAVVAFASENLEEVKKNARAGGEGAGKTEGKKPNAPPSRPSGGGPAEGEKAPEAKKAAEPARVPPPAPQAIEGAPQGASTHDVLAREPFEAGRSMSRRESVKVGPEHTAERLMHDAADMIALKRPEPDQREGRVLSSPLARRIAAEKGLDLAEITGSGPGGRILQRDVMVALEQRGARPHPPAGAVGGVVGPARVARGQKQVIPLTKIRGVIAQRLQLSKQTIPHFYETIDVDAENLVSLRTRLNKQLEAHNVRLSLGDLVAKGVAVALTMHPALNATFDGKEITRHGDVNLGMAVALPDGLIVPVLRGISNMGLREIREKSADLVDRARAQKLKQDELTGATFTVSNLGTYGVRDFAAIVNPPEVGILAIGGAEKRAVVRNDQIVARTTMAITLSADHRVVDGATAAEFLRTLKGLLEEPGMMLV